MNEKSSTKEKRRARAKPEKAAFEALQQTPG
jgi:hypothetical protein